jgi:ribonuclease P protein component
MLPKKNRLDLKKDFFQIKKDGQVINEKFFNFLFQIKKPTNNRHPLTSIFQPPAFAFIVSKKIDKRTTKRNRIKRLLSEVIRGFLPQIRPGVKGVFFIKKEALEKNFAEIKAEIEKIFKKQNLFK